MYECICKRLTQIIYRIVLELGQVIKCVRTEVQKGLREYTGGEEKAPKLLFLS